MKAAIKLNKFKGQIKIMYSAVTVTNVNACVRSLRDWKLDIKKNLPNTEIGNKYSHSIPN